MRAATENPKQRKRAKSLPFIPHPLPKGFPSELEVPSARGGGRAEMKLTGMTEISSLLYAYKILVTNGREFIFQRKKVYFGGGRTGITLLSPYEHFPFLLGN
jgi:hypothetical protein